MPHQIQTHYHLTIHYNTYNGSRHLNELPPVPRRNVHRQKVHRQNDPLYANYNKVQLLLQLFSQLIINERLYSTDEKNAIEAGPYYNLR